MANEYRIKKFDGGMHYILLDKKTVLALTKENNKRVICRLNDEMELHCAIISKKEGGHFISIGSATCKKLKIKEGSKVKATFTVDNSKYQFEMPEELKEVLNTDPEADKIFHSLTKGNQRGLIYLVLQVKSSDKRIEKALKITEKIKMGITSPKLILKYPH
ncbi:MAG: DUF1905 domain-containing protein [Chitinophagaceae bacterium]|nr:MAG: DUF1905 domain-containing protein [Chitinophagaceae bacterium]